MAVTAYITVTTYRTAHADNNVIYKMANVDDADTAAVAALTGLAAAITEANSIVDAHVRLKHDPDDVSTDPILTGAAFDLCTYLWLSRVRRDLVADNPVYKEAYDRAISTLKAIGGGKMSLTYPTEHRTEASTTLRYPTIGVSVATTDPEGQVTNTTGFQNY